MSPENFPYKNVQVAGTQDPANACSISGCYVSGAVTDEETACWLHRPPSHDADKHTWRRFATVANVRIFWPDTVRQMWAKRKSVNTRAKLSKLPLHSSVEFVDGVFVEIAPSDSRLISNDKNVVTSIVAHTNSFLGARKPTQMHNPVRIADVFVERAIAIKKCRRPRNIPLRRHAAKRTARQCVYSRPNYRN